MEFISAEEFLKQNEEIQKVLFEWWENDCSSYDLITFVNDKYPRFYCDLEYGENYEGLIPLLTEGQIRRFIEDKTGYKVVLLNNLALPIEIWLINKDGNRRIFTDKHDVLQAYWKVAIEIAKHETR